MKIILSVLIIGILTTGCTTRNAFSKLDITKEQEAAIENTRSGKITSSKQLEGIYSAIYLNNVYQNEEAKHYNFYISMYLKNKTNDLNITLNKQEAVLLKKLPEKNKYAELLGLKVPWTNNYFVSFKRDENNESAKLILQIDNDQFSSGQLTYVREQL